jgi:hypothetical protein
VPRLGRVVKVELNPGAARYDDPGRISAGAAIT